jgi:Ser/Thr protein kinase RdoA (MazF antagonist)
VSDYAEAYGVLAAQIHRAADGFRSPYRRFPLDAEHLLWRPLRAADPLLAERPADRDWLHATVGLLQDRFAAVAGDLTTGPCHGDLTGGNAVVDGDGLTMFDFDSGGPGPRAYDLGVFVWSTRLQGRPAQDVARFLAGYERVRPLSPAERAALDLFAAVREVWFIGLQTENAPDWGYGLADDDFLTQRLAFLRQLVEPLAG